MPSPCGPGVVPGSSSSETTRKRPRRQTSRPLGSPQTHGSFFPERVAIGSRVEGFLTKAPGNRFRRRASDASRCVGRRPSPSVRRPPDYSPAVLVYAVVSAETEKAVDTFVRREDAERFLEEVRGDDASYFGSRPSNSTA
jgi:hypothetical protein